jgi:hypothetical protein
MANCVPIKSRSILVYAGNDYTDPHLTAYNNVPLALTFKTTTYGKDLSNGFTTFNATHSGSYLFLLSGTTVTDQSLFSGFAPSNVYFSINGIPQQFFSFAENSFRFIFIQAYSISIVYQLQMNDHVSIELLPAAASSPLIEGTTLNLTIMRLE